MPLPVNTGIVTLSEPGGGTGYFDEEYVCAVWELEGVSGAQAQVLLRDGTVHTYDETAADIKASVTTNTMRTSSFPDGRTLYIALENLTRIEEDPDDATQSILYFQGGGSVPCNESATTIRDALITALGGTP
ncbi:MAG: hypothetical protein GXP62_04060 [Oligoflexia bacterium]|nr:hypothetical protein [Oligoflexia bacterium]